MIRSREELIEFTLRSLGSPVIQINVTQEQLEDRLDDTLDLFNEYNLGGTHKHYLRYQVTENDIYNEYLPIPGSSILGITRIIPVTRTMFGAQGILFDPMYHLMANQMNTLTHGWASIDLTSYVQFRQYAETLELILRPRPNVIYNRYMNRLYLEWNWGHRNWNTGGMLTEDGMKVLDEADEAGDDIKLGIDFELEKPVSGGRGFQGLGSSPDIFPGDFVIIECHKILDAEEFPDVYGDRWLKQYFKQQVKLQFGTNLSKYSGMVLPGGVQLDGSAMVQEALAEIDKLRDELLTSYQEPLRFAIG